MKETARGVVKENRLEVVKEKAQEVTYLIMDGNSRVIVYEFTLSDGSFETTVTAFLSAYCIKTGSSIETMIILAQVKGEQFDGIKSKATVAMHACRDHSSIRLTKRERECSELLLRDPGIANKEIASKLNLSERTVKFHISALLAKCKVDRRSGLGAKLRLVLPGISREME